MVKRKSHKDVYLTRIQVLPVTLIIICCACSFIPKDLMAQNTRPGEYKVKAAFLYNLIKFIDLPVASFSDSPKIMLCILGEDPFDRDIDLIKGKPVKERTLEVIRVSGIEEARGCQIIYISPSEKNNITQIIRDTENRGILTVGDTEGFSRQGVIINFILVQDKVRFEININAAKQANVRISSRLLSLARIIDEKQEGN